MQEFREALRKKVTDDSTVQGLISERFYPASLATVADPVAPCANFYIPSGDQPVNTEKIQTVNFYLYIWSAEHYKQAYQVFEAIKDVLEFKPSSTSDIYFVCQMTMRPREEWDDINRWYYLVTNWTATCLKRT